MTGFTAYIRGSARKPGLSLFDIVPQIREYMRNFREYRPAVFRGIPDSNISGIASKSNAGIKRHLERMFVFVLRGGRSLDIMGDTIK